MGFFKNINATPRTGSAAMHPDGFSIYTDNGWKKYTEKDILVNARIVERAEGVSYKYIDESYMHSVYAPYSVIKGNKKGYF